MAKIEVDIEDEAQVSKLFNEEASGFITVPSALDNGSPIGVIISMSDRLYLTGRQKYTVKAYYEPDPEAEILCGHGPDAVFDWVEATEPISFVSDTAAEGFLLVRKELEAGAKINMLSVRDREGETVWDIRKPQLKL